MHHEVSQRQPRNARAIRTGRQPKKTTGGTNVRITNEGRTASARKQPRRTNRGKTYLHMPTLWEKIQHDRGKTEPLKEHR